MSSSTQPSHLSVWALPPWGQGHSWFSTFNHSAPHAPPTNRVYPLPHQQVLAVAQGHGLELAQALRGKVKLCIREGGAGDDGSRGGVCGDAPECNTLQHHSHSPGHHVNSCTVQLTPSLPSFPPPLPPYLEHGHILLRVHPHHLCMPCRGSYVSNGRLVADVASRAGGISNRPWPCMCSGPAGSA
jgi:hypothetical protein